MPKRYVGVLIFAQTGNGISFLLGKEKGAWSDFGGSPDHITEFNIKNYRLEAARECEEETMGLLGNAQKISKYLNHYFETSLAIIFLLKIEYDPTLPIFFKRFYDYGSKCHTGCDGYYEKDEIKWFRMDEIRQHRNIKFRSKFNIFIKNVIENDYWKK
jgi:hypothetical protein